MQAPYVRDAVRLMPMRRA